MSCLKVCKRCGEEKHINMFGKRSASKRRGHMPPNYNLKELETWVLSQPNFCRLYDDWSKSGYARELSPSCDRNRNDLGYDFNRLTLMTWGENRKNANKDMQNGNLIHGNNPQKSVIGTCLETNKQLDFCSTMDAERKTNIDHRRISLSCKGKLKSVGGYTWKYKTIKG